MRLAKPVAVGVAAGLLVPVVVLVALAVAGFGVAATGGGGIARLSVGLIAPITISLFVVGFSIGFGWMLRRSRLTSRRQ
jgi:hypothetical protein